MEIEELVLPCGKTLINVPADYMTLTEIGLSEEEINKAMLSHAKLMAKKNLRVFAKTARAELAGHTDEYQLSNWSTKARRSEKILDGSATKKDIAIVKAECDRRDKGETHKKLAEKQLEKSHALAEANGIIDGLESRGRKSIDGKKTIKSLEELINDLHNDAKKELSVLLRGNNCSDIVNLATTNKK